MDSFEANVSLVKAPLLFSENISDAHEHENSAIVIVILLRIVVSNYQTILFFIEHFWKFYCVAEDGILKIVLRTMFHAVMNDQFSLLKDTEIPMIAVVDWHDQNMAFVECLFFEYSLNLIIWFCESVGGEVWVEDSIGGDWLSNEFLFHHLNVDVNDIIIEPFSEMEPS